VDKLYHLCLKIVSCKKNFMFVLNSKNIAHDTINKYFDIFLTTIIQASFCLYLNKNQSNF